MNDSKFRELPDIFAKGYGSLALAPLISQWNLQAFTLSPLSTEYHEEKHLH
jgi:hypothetical protein